MAATGSDHTVDSTTDQQQVCPVCEATDLEADVYGFDGLCQACGFVIQDTNTQDELPDWVGGTESTAPAKHTSWQEHCQVTNATEAQLADAFGLIEEFSDHLPLPTDQRAAAAEAYGRAFRAELTDGRATEDMIAACLRVGSVQNDMPIPTGRLTALESVSKTTFRACRQDIQSELEYPTVAVSPAKYRWLFEAELDVAASTLSEAQSFLESISDETVLVGKSPAGIAAAGLYWTADDITQQAVADVAGVTTETIRLRVTDFEEVVE
jgi:transcription initiation factor TFIIB